MLTLKDEDRDGLRCGRIKFQVVKAFRELFGVPLIDAIVALILTSIWCFGSERCCIVYLFVFPSFVS